MTDYDIFLDLINKQDPRTLNYLEKNAEDIYSYPDVIANVASDDNYALRAACRRGHLDVVNRLLGLNEDGVNYEFPAVVDDIAANNNYALLMGCKNGVLVQIIIHLEKIALRLSFMPLPQITN